MCIITRMSDDVVVSISLIPGLLDDRVFDQYKVYWPVEGPLPNEGDIWVGESELLVSNDSL